jgi:hypothetical protein
LVGIAAAAAVVVGVLVSAASPGDDDSVIAADTSATIVAGRDGATDRDKANNTDDKDGGESAPGGDPDGTTEDAPIPEATVPVEDTGTPTNSPGEPRSSDLPVWGATSEPTGAPPPPPPPAPAPSPPPPTAPPPPAALSASSSCSPSCVIPRGGKFEITVTNSGGQSGKFTVTMSDGLGASPSQGSVAPGQTRTIDIIDTLNKRRRGLTVEVRGPNGAILFTATVDVRG